MKKKLLLKLARHLDDGKLGHKRFDFAQYNSGKEAKCGTAGCAIGELPILYPDKWKFESNYGDVLLKKASMGDVVSDVEKFFDLTYDEAQHLFYPNQQNTEKYGGFELDYYATRYQVASNIRDFIAKKEGK